MASAGAEPLYERVKAYVVAQLDRSDRPEGQRLPSENELVAALGVSRMTVNRALRDLVAEGRITRIQGLGSFAAPQKPQTALIEIRDIAEEIRARGGAHSAVVEILTTIDDPGPALLAEFEFAAARPIAHSIVLHSEDGAPVLIEERFVNTSLAPHYAEQDFTRTTTYDYLSRRVPLTEVEHVISAIAADAATAGKLKIAEGEPCLLLHRRTWWNGEVVTVNNFIYAGSRITLGSRYRPAIVGQGA